MTAASPPPTSARFDLHGVTVRVKVDDPMVLDAVRARLGPFAVTGAGLAEVVCDITCGPPVSSAGDGRPFLVREGCLTRGLTRYRFLRRAGVEVSRAFGTGRVDGRLEAHCWLTLDGPALREPDDGRSFQAMAVVRAPGVVE